MNNDERQTTLPPKGEESYRFISGDRGHGFSAQSANTGHYAQLNTYMTSAEYATFDWHQKRDSQLIGRGTLDTAYRPADSVTRDLDGNERVLNRTIDLGCWEKMLSVGFFYILR